MRNKGILIAIEGLYGCGKQTQSQLLKENLEKLGHKVRLVSAPYYGKWHCQFVEKQLDGYFGTDVKEVNPYMASNFYAIDRLGAYIEDWKEDYDNGVIIICDRYVGSNMMYQSAKLDSDEEKLELMRWIGQLEYTINGLPSPDLNIFLSVKPETSEKLRKNRLNKATGGETQDIYESNLEFLKETYKKSTFVADLLDWKIVECDTNGTMRSIEDISKEILTVVKNHVKLEQDSL